MRSIADNIDKVLRKVFARHDKAFAEIMIHWHKITGPQFGSRTFPLKISQMTEKGLKINTLHVGAKDAATSLEFSYHQDVVIERIAVYFGYKHVDKLRIKIM
ncbi:MAG: DUF721 domain-containing protein [Pseudomonadota bacterium]